MTGLAQSTSLAEPTEPEAAVEPAVPDPKPGRRRSRWSGAAAVLPAVGLLACGVAGGVAIAWFIVLGPGPTGSKAQWFFGAVVFVAVVVSLWQTRSLQRQAKREAAAAAQALQTQLAAAEERSARELELAQTAHAAEMEAQRSLHRAELEAQREMARISRLQLVGQLQKQAMIAVSRAVSAHAHMLATLWNQAASVLSVEDRAERERALNPIFEQIGQVVADFSVELSNAHLLVEDDRMHQALDSVNAAVLAAIRVAEDVHVAAIEGRSPQPNPIPAAQQLMNKRAAEARHLAWDLLRTGLDDSAATPGDHLVDPM